MQRQSPNAGGEQTSRQKMRQLTMQGSLVATGAEAARLLIQFATVAVLARILSPSEFGQYAMAAVVTAFAGMFTDLGLSTATIQRKSMPDNALSGLFYLTVLLGLAFAGLSMALAPFAAAFFDEAVVASLIMALSLTLPVIAAGRQHMALLRREMRWLAADGISISATLAGATAAIGAALWGYGVWSLVIQALVAAAVELVALWLWMPWRPGRPGSWDETRSAVGFGVNLTLFGLMNFLHRQSDDAMIGWRWGAADLGYYNRAYSLLLVPIQIFRSALTKVALPVLSRLQDDDRAWAALYSSMIGGALVVIVPACLVMIVLANEIVLVLFGPGWDASIGLFQILSTSIVAQLVMSSTGWLWISKNQTRQMMKWALYSVPVMITGMLIGLPYGAAGVATGYVVTFCLLTPVCSWVATRTLPITMAEIYRPVAGPVGAGSVAFLSAWLLGNTPLAQTLILLVAYTVLILIFDRRTVTGLFNLLRKVVAER